MQVVEREQPVYRLKYYNEFVYKIIKFKRSGLPYLPDPNKAKEEPDGKFSQSYCRARSMILQYALCNHWDYFITITLDERIRDRYDIDGALADLVRWLIEYRREFKTKVKFVLIPELHEEKQGRRAVHFHGFISGILPDHVGKFIPGLHPQKLIDGGFLAFPLLALNFGFVSMSPIKNPVGAAFYIMKYITKALSGARTGFYDHLYTASRGLSKSLPACDLYRNDGVLDSFLTNDMEFCKTGWITDRVVTGFDPFVFGDGAYYFDDFCRVALGPGCFDTEDPVGEIAPDLEVIEVFEGVQLAIEGYLRGCSRGE